MSKHAGAEGRGSRVEFGPSPGGSETGGLPGRSPNRDKPLAQGLGLRDPPEAVRWRAEKSAAKPGCDSGRPLRLVTRGPLLRRWLGQPTTEGVRGVPFHWLNIDR